MNEIVQTSETAAQAQPTEAAASQAPESAEITACQSAGELALGQWYWVKTVAKWDNEQTGVKDGDEYEWFGCAVQIGSNYVKIKSPTGSYIRVHLDDYWSMLRREENPEAVIANQVEACQARSKALIAEIHALTQRLGVAKSRAISGPASSSGESTGSALVTLSGQSDLHAYQNALTLAKEKTLPALHEELKKANEQLVVWIKASSLALEASIVPMHETIQMINDRLFSFGLYAGLAESAVQCCGGAPAAHDEPLHVMQRRCYMDEEALLSYEAGGMDFNGIGAFDAWLSKPENRDRILPFPRTLVAMRVRRTTKERETHGDLLASFIKIEEEHADKWTFLYVRNGEQVWRIACEIDFGPMIFPDGAIYRDGEPLMVKMHANSVDRIITRAEYDQNLVTYQEIEAKSKAWRRENPKEHQIRDPYMSSMGGTVEIRGFGSFRPYDWKPFDRSNVHYDEVMEVLNAKVKEYNRVAVIIQGLFDRSEILHPHPPVQTWRPESFSRSVRLVFDSSRALYDGEKPDFEAFRAKLNASMGPGSVVVGQERYWMAREADRENARRDRTYRSGASSYRYEFYKPDGNPGPGRIAMIEEWKPRARVAVFSWEREARRWGRPPILQTLTVPAAEMFNISAYKAGDFKQFFTDPRTRAEYLKWAPLLLTAEDFLAGKLKITERNVN
ncbi:hypothetical protein [Ralstonia insidiosa]|jgi:hypothetical protein|nr:hypothetical protein [Ralstonia insidiosa]MBA9939317.1 hypothetical protein [Ralstonia insidiosa]MBC9968088.1 hypothetical protein [Ralstonia insidiosa]MBX3904349.1 hypothetical protein [Ralstonia insidiosa]